MVGGVGGRTGLTRPPTRFSLFFLDFLEKTCYILRLSLICTAEVIHSFL